MKLIDVLSITKFDDNNSYRVTVWEASHKRAVEMFAVRSSTSPEYGGQIYSKTQRDEIKRNKRLLKKYGEYEVDHIQVCGNTVYFSLTEKEEE